MYLKKTITQYMYVKYSKEHIMRGKYPAIWGPQGFSVNHLKNQYIEQVFSMGNFGVLNGSSLKNKAYEWGKTSSTLTAVSNSDGLHSVGACMTGIPNHGGIRSN